MMKKETQLLQAIDQVVNAKQEFEGLKLSIEKIRDIDHRQGDVAKFTGYMDESRLALREEFYPFVAIWHDSNKADLVRSLIADVERRRNAALMQARARGNTMQETHRAPGEADALDGVLERLRDIGWMDGIKSPMEI
jgi:hypothetical protein